MNPHAEQNDKGEFILSEYVGRKHNLDRVGATVEDEPAVEHPTACPHCKKPLDAAKENS